MTDPADAFVTRRGLAMLGSASVAVLATPSQAAPATARMNEARIDVTLPPFNAVGDGQIDDSGAIIAAVAALPARGGVVVLPSAFAYRLGGTITDGGKAVAFEIGHTRVIAPPGQTAFDLRTNGSSLTGAGPGATAIAATPPGAPPRMPTLAIELDRGKVAACRVRDGGAGLRSTPLAAISASPTKRDAALVLGILDGRVVEAAVVASGEGYAAAPTARFLGGGEAVVRISEAQHCRVQGLSIDLGSIPHAVGIFHRGGWYADVANIDVVEARRHETAIALFVESFTRGEPGINGAWGGAYVSRYANVVAKRTVVLGHDRSTATTLHFDTLDAANVHIHGAIAITMTNPVLQGNAGAFLDLVNVDGLTITGGDLEGEAVVLHVRGVCNNVRLAPLSYSATGPLVHGAVGTGWRIDLARSNAGDESLQTGNGGSAGVAYQNTGWIEKHRQGLHYSGDSIVYSSNIKLTGPSEGVLDNPANAGFALVMTASAQLLLKYADRGAGPVRVHDIAQFDPAGVRLPGLPSSRPPRGSQRLWYDPADNNRIKFEP